MKIFLSHSSKDKDIAEKIFLALLESGHDVFYDRDRLQAGKSYNKTIKSELHASDLLVFLISPNSIKPSSYTLTEIKYAQRKWKHPKNHVLPVMVKNTNYAKIPNYIKAVTVFNPDGNIPAEVASEVDYFNKGVNIKKINIKYLALALVSIIIIILATYYVKYASNQYSESHINFYKASKTNDNNRYLENNSDKKCIRNNKINYIELGSKYLRIELDNKKQVTLGIRENSNLLATVVLNIFSENKMLKIDSITDSNCNKISNFFNDSVGGNKYILNNWETLGININENKYFVRLGYVENSIEVITSYTINN